MSAECDVGWCVSYRFHNGPCLGLGQTNPWAGITPDCPNGHHSRDVYFWAAGELPWICVPCKRRFA